MAIGNPYAAPAVDDAAVVEPRPWLFPLVSLGLGVLWWAALLLPEVSGSMLLAGTRAAQVWGFVRVVGLVGGASWLYRRMRRAWPKGAWLSAIFCVWGGASIFVGTAFIDESGLLPVAMLVGPPMFILFAWYVVLPMTAVTAFALSLVERKRVFR